MCFEKATACHQRAVFVAVVRRGTQFALGQLDRLSPALRSLLGGSLLAVRDCMSRPTVSIVIPTYNRAGLISRAIISALVQVMAGDEVIVVDDGSKDRTPAIVASFGPQVRYIPVPNGGAGRARNIGIDHAQGELIAFLDSDDEWFPGKLDLQRTLMRARPDVLYSFSNFSAHSKAARPFRTMRVIG